jgi:hypothetical protein
MARQVPIGELTAVGVHGIANRRRRGLDRKELETAELPASASSSPDSLLAVENKSLTTSPSLQKFGQGDHAVVAIIADAVPIRAQYAV